jgi:hypothetical protein
MALSVIARRRGKRPRGTLLETQLRQLRRNSSLNQPREIVDAEAENDRVRNNVYD